MFGNFSAVNKKSVKTRGGGKVVLTRTVHVYTVQKPWPLKDCQTYSRVD